VLLDTHSPNSFRQSPFVLPEASAQDLRKEKRTTVALRIYRPPLPANVEFREGKPLLLGCNGRQREILAFAGPWKRKGDWWSETEWAREEWDVKVRTLHPKFQAERRIAVEDETALYRVYKDLREKRWFVEGIYD
jgi:protein ImuB